VTRIDSAGRNSARGSSRNVSRRMILAPGEARRRRWSSFKCGFRLAGEEGRACCQPRARVIRCRRNARTSLGRCRIHIPRSPFCSAGRRRDRRGDRGVRGKLDIRRDRSRRTPSIWWWRTSAPFDGTRHTCEYRRPAASDVSRPPAYVHSTCIARQSNPRAARNVHRYETNKQTGQECA